MILRNSHNPIKFACERFKRVVFVLGNHEFWGTYPEFALQKAEKLDAQFENLDVLEHRVIEIEGHRFVGATLWYPWTPVCEMEWFNFNDFKRIKRLKNWVSHYHQRTRHFLDSTVQEGDVVITHHLPSYQCISHKWRYASSNCFYASHLDPLIEAAKPKVWVHGHSHESLDRELYSTRVIRNPFGYEGYSVNMGFHKRMVFLLE